MNRFEERLAEHKLALKRTTLTTLQLNLGRQCNQACRHCHVDAAPWRTETMGSDTAERIIDWIAQNKPQTVDITGGAPELCQQFKRLVIHSRQVGCEVIDRCNLTILEEPGFEWLAQFLAENEVTVIASLPCYLPENVNRQRGNGVFQTSIQALQKLNQLGYGKWLPLHLVYNPVGPTLPPPQEDLQADYAISLQREFGITFNRLFTITNQPIARFAEDLRKQDRWDEYMALLANSFNPNAVDGLMCQDTLSVSHEGRLYDCDFNQMLDLKIRNGRELFLWDASPENLTKHPITTGDHCLACTAGDGSSCTGALTESAA